MQMFTLAALLMLPACSGDTDKNTGDDSGDTTGTDDGGTDDGGTDDGGTDDGSGGDPCEQDSITIELGTGAAGYEPIDDGTTVTSVHGLQGGWHIDVAFAAYQAGAIAKFEVYGYDVATGERVCSHGDSPLQVALLPVDECQSIFYGVRCFVDCPVADAIGADIGDATCDTPPEALNGRELRLELSMTDEDERPGSDDLIIVFGADEIDPTECTQDYSCETAHEELDTGDTGTSSVE